MIYELRTYRMKVGTVPAYLKLVDEEGIAVQKSHLGTLVGYFSTELGPLNEIVHLWAFADLNDRETRRAALLADARWQVFLPKIRGADRNHGNQDLETGGILAAALSRHRPPYPEEPAKRASRRFGHGLKNGRYFDLDVEHAVSIRGHEKKVIIADITSARVVRDINHSVDLMDVDISPSTLVNGTRIASNHLAEDGAQRNENFAPLSFGRSIVTTTKLIVASAFGLSLLASTAAFAKDMVFTSWGGTTQDAQKKAWVDPFEKKDGIVVKLDGPTDYGKLKAMVDSGNVDWDVVDVEGDFAVAAAKAGLLEPLDFSVIQKADLDPRFTADHYIGSFYYSFVLGYNKDALGGKEPKTWVDLFDTKSYPGKRTFYKWSAPGVLEIALLADGVPADKLYPLDLDRAFKKLDTIKSDIVWWGGGAQSQQLLASGEAPIGAFWNGRIFAVQKDEPSVGLSWNQNLTAADVLVVPKGAKNKAEAMKFLATASSPQPQADLASLTSYAPINTQSAKLMPAAEAKTLPDQHTESQINLDMTYWAAHRDEIGKRWYDWQAK